VLSQSRKSQENQDSSTMENTVDPKLKNVLMYV
jgi:hypothetical protein